MSYNARKRRGLILFFWLVWIFNLAQYAGIIYSNRHTSKVEGNSSSGDITLAIAFFFIFFPLLFASLGLILTRRYFPDRELRPAGKVTLIILSILQILCAFFMGLGSLSSLLVDLSRDNVHITMGVLLKPPYLMATSILVAAVWNLAAGIVVWRTIRVIRRNSRTALLASFESI